MASPLMSSPLTSPRLTLDPPRRPTHLAASWRPTLLRRDDENGLRSAAQRGGSGRPALGGCGRGVVVRAGDGEGSLSACSSAFGARARGRSRRSVAEEGGRVCRLGRPQRCRELLYRGQEASSRSPPSASFVRSAECGVDKAMAQQRPVSVE